MYTDSKVMLDKVDKVGLGVSQSLVVLEVAVLLVLSAKA